MNYICNFGVTGGTIDITVVSTANGNPTPYSFVWDGGETGDDGIQIIQIRGGDLRVTVADTPLAITGVITLTQERAQANDGVINIHVFKKGATLYAGGTAEVLPAQSELSVMSLATVEPVSSASPFMLNNPGKGSIFEFSAPFGTMTVCIAIPAALGAPQKVMSTTPQYEMTALFELSGVQVTVGDVLCNVYYVTSPVQHAGTKKFQVII